MIRRFVVFTDNFSQGTLAYEHSPLVTPNSISLLALAQINENGEAIMASGMKRHQDALAYTLIYCARWTVKRWCSWYVELKPLVDEAYQELGYPEENFTDILQDAITKVLDMEIPKERLELVRPSVMYQYKDEDIEKLDDAEKLMLRLGKENLLVIKSVLLEISEKISQTVKKVK